MTNETFPQYGVDGPGAARWAVLMLSERAGQQSNFEPTQATEAMSETEALEFLESVARREQGTWVDIGDDDLVLQVSAHELIIYRQGFWTGDRLIRVVAGRVR